MSNKEILGDVLDDETPAEEDAWFEQDDESEDEQEEDKIEARVSVSFLSLSLILQLRHCKSVMLFGRQEEFLLKKRIAERNCKRFLSRGPSKLRNNMGKSNSEPVGVKVGRLL